MTESDDLMVQKCSQCRWEISLHGADAGERGLVAWVAHVAAIHPDRYPAAREAFLERLRASERDAQTASIQANCAATGHQGGWTYENGGRYCLNCDALITTDWVKQHYEASGYKVTVNDDSITLTQADKPLHRNPQDGGEKQDVDLPPQLKGIDDYMALFNTARSVIPAFERLSLLIAKALEPPAEHWDHLRDKLGEPPENKG